MKTKYFLTLVVTFLTIGSAFAQQKISNEEAQRLINAYKRNARVFLNLETCGDGYDGPAYMLKQAENYSLDRIIQITPEEEADLGARTYAQEAPYVIPNERHLPMLRAMVARLASYSARPNITFHVYVVQSNEVNAFSTIGNYIFVNSAMLNFVNSTDELAFVLGHEISHIVNKHLVRKEKKIALLTSIGQKLNYQQFSNVAINLNMNLSAPFDQIDEYDADRSSLNLVKKAGYNPAAFNDFFAKIEKYDRKDLLSRFTATHPNSANRRKCLNKLLGK